MGKRGRTDLEELFATQIRTKINNIDLILAGDNVSKLRRSWHEGTKAKLEAELARRKAGGESPDDLEVK